MLLLLLYQGSFTPFSDVPVFRLGGVPKRGAVKRKHAETAAYPFAELEQQLAAAQQREAKAIASLAATERAATETQAKATQARRQAAIARYAAAATKARTEITQLNAAMAVEEARITEETDIVFILAILNEV